ncbi:vWA domain-containing protein, partial [Salmonella sp. s54412]|uniref:vWA domain-containing protein n=1 Tax=Salmonella sp. s54412 TaxID=3160128 RepID=UPI003754E94B
FLMMSVETEKKIMVLFTDGVQNSPSYKEGLAAAGRKLEKNNVKVFGILTGKQLNINTFLKLCSNDKLVFNHEFLPEIIETMSSEMEYLC